MITQTVTVEERNAPNIIIGRRGSYNTEEIVFDLTYLAETFGDGTAVLLVKRPMDTVAYPATTEQDGSTLTWTVSTTDTSYKGHGECELYWYVDSGLAKSVIYSVTVLRDIGDTAEEPPDPYETWVDTLTELGAETLQNAQNAAVSEANAEQSAEDAADSATLSESWSVGGTGTRTGEDTNNAKFWSDMAQEAASEQGWVYFYIDGEGILHYVKTENAALTFYIDVSGILHVTNA